MAVPFTLTDGTEGKKETGALRERDRERERERERERARQSEKISYFLLAGGSRAQRARPTPDSSDHTDHTRHDTRATLRDSDEHDVQVRERVHGPRLARGYGCIEGKSFGS
jgi:hypothetical protein